MPAAAAGPPRSRKGKKGVLVLIGCLFKLNNRTIALAAAAAAGQAVEGKTTMRGHHHHVLRPGRARRPLVGRSVACIYRQRLQERLVGGGGLQVLSHS